MLRPVATLLTVALLASPALAQSGVGYEGNWACRANVDGTKSGLLTILAGNYAYASANFGSKASGTGRVEMYQDGVMFQDGNLLANAGINAARLTPDEQGNTVLVLTTSERAILTCRPRGG